ncbi:MAG: DUF4926 domain-containing protein [Gammaproteobacteria bacterium]|nr:DUF4926 domain-containing protein [Gammaproteobacteria bacterium]
MAELLSNADKARVDKSKITEYLLSPSHPDGWSKAKFFSSLGFTNLNEDEKMISISEHDRIVLTKDVPEAKLAVGDVGVVIHVHGDDRAYEIEFVALDGVTIAAVTLDHDYVRPVESHEISHTRRVA